MKEPSLHVLLIDNYDSFTYNIVSLLVQTGIQVSVRQATDLMPGELYHYPWAGVIIGPGPGHPSLLGEILPPLFPPALNLPILGICLGHQYIVHGFGGQVEPMKRPLFGIQRPISHNGEELFEGLPSPLPVGLYHALHASYVPEVLEITAQDQEGHCMAIRHREYPIWGLQFHPDSILSPHGREILARWVGLLTSLSAKNVPNNV
ncbi:MAG: aminodeoxychorismate/anthranilate synthase component II [Bacteroidia bacterium]|nr:aminodeoxychorismate/anthranilate synthase component II [Bacteroidia bacterium]MDW8235513.1 aminodeoxychorismate/anthranilate synthase component II [Bacteroidia bacterium]